jgi:ankyrin repeat protein
MQTHLDASLLAASARGHDTIVQDLLARGARPDGFRLRLYFEKYTAMRLVSKLGHSEVVRILIKSGALINYNVEPSHRTALYEAAESGHADIVQILLAHGADPDIHSHGWSPLRIAVFYGHLAVAEALISVGADRDIRPVNHTAGLPSFRRGKVNYRNDLNLDNTTLLKLAVGQEDISMVRLLLDSGASLDDVDDHDETVLHLAARWCDRLMIRMLLGRGAFVDAPGPNGTALVVAASLGRHPAAKALLDHGADLSDCKWHSPVLAAAYNGHPSIVWTILSHRVSVNESGAFGTALYQAVQNNLQTLVRMLLQYGAVPDEHKEGTQTPLQIAVVKRYVGVMRLLIAGGASIDRDEWPEHFLYHDPGTLLPRVTTEVTTETLRQLGDPGVQEAELLSRALTPLQIAVTEGSPEVVKILLDSGADFNKGRWYTPLQIAVTMGYIDIVEMLLDRGAHPNITWPGGTLLELAIRFNHKTIVRLLIKYGATVEEHFEMGQDPLQVAAFYGHVQTARLLLAVKYKRIINTPISQRAEVIAKSRLGSALSIAVCAESCDYDSPGGYDRLGIVRLLLEPGFLNKNEWIPALHHVVQNGYTRYLRLFLEHGIDVNELFVRRWSTSVADAPPTTSWKLLPVASFYGHEGIVRLLLHCGAEINDKSKGSCALACAAAGRQESMMQLLVKRGANIDIAIQVAWCWTNSRKITRRLRRLHTSLTSPADQFSEWPDYGFLSLLNESCAQPPGEQTIPHSPQEPLLVMEEYVSDPSQSPVEGATSRRRSRISSTVSRLRSRLSKI